MNINKSKKLFEQAQIHIPGGVNSPVRAFKSVNGNPIFIKKGIGSSIFDVDDNKYIDYLGSWGPHLFGHNPLFIKKAIAEALENGSSFGAPTESEVKMADLICELVPSIEKVRMVNSGTEATMSAIRLARGYTKKDKIIKFEGCYHGHGDSFLIKAGSGALTFGVPTSPGVTNGTAKDTLLAKFNDINSVKELITGNRNEIASIIIEPIAGNMGVIKANLDFLIELREISTKENIILIFDEVMSGFRVAQGGAAELFDIKPDLITLGKIIGGGLPVGAFGGKAKIMDNISPLGEIYQAGTLSGNPLAMSAGIAALTQIKEHHEIYNELEVKSLYLENGFKRNLKEFGFNYRINRVGSMLCQFFTEKEVVDFDSAISSNTNLYAKYFHSMLNQGVYLPPSQFESFFISTAHSMEDLDNTISAHSEAIRQS